MRLSEPLFFSPHATKTFRINTLEKKMCLHQKELINFKRQPLAHPPLDKLGGA